MLFFFILLIIFIIISCRKDAPKKIARQLEGTWKISEIRYDSITIYDVPEKFTFNKCKDKQDINNGDCTGIFITSDDKEENFKWLIKSSDFYIINSDTNSVVYKYTGQSHIEEHSKSKFIFSKCYNLCIAYKKETIVLIKI